MPTDNYNSDNDDRPSNNGAHSTALRRIPLEEIESAVKSIRYGVVQIIIQDGVVVQIDKTEKLRLLKQTS